MALAPAWRAAIAAAATTIVLAGVFVTQANAATLISDDFNDGNVDGWSKSGGSWSVSSGAYQQTGTSANAKAQIGSTSWTAQSVTARVRPDGFGGSSSRAVGVAARAQSMSSFYSLVLTPSSVQLRRGTSVLTSASFGTVTGNWYTLTLTASGSSLTGSVNGTPLVSASDGTWSSGRVGLVTAYAAASFDDFVVTDTPGPAPTGTPTSSPSTSPPPPGSCTTSGSPTGFAAVNAWGRNGTTGGAGGPKVEVDTASEFINAIGQSGPLQICVRGMINLPAGMYDVTSDKTVAGIGANSGISGGGLNIGLPVDDSITSPPANAVHNVIIRNLVFRNASDDSINVQMFSHHVWIDHNDLAQGYDGLIDIKRGSSYITVSWNHLHDHTKNMLLGHSDGNAEQDAGGRLRVTYHHNWLDHTPQRNPRVRFGDPVHVFNNYYIRNSDIGVACQADAGCMVEGNYFEDTEETVSNHYSGPTGRCVARNNVLVGESGQPDCSGAVEEPSNYYPYTLDNPANVKAIVMAGSGVGKI